MLPALFATALLVATAPAAAVFPHATRAVTPRVVLPKAPLLQLDERPFALDDLKGKWVWLYLGYSNCPDLCPTTLTYMAAEYRNLAHPERVQPVFVSVDPTRDTPEKLVSYVHYFHPGFLGVTGKPENLLALARGLGTRYVIDKPTHPGESYVVEHPDLVFLLDPAGRLAAVYHPDPLVGAGALSSDTDTQLALGESAPSTTIPPVLGTGAAWCGSGDPDPSRDLQLARMMTLGSGTSVLPAAAPMRMVTWHLDDWLLAASGFVSVGYTQQLAALRGASGPADENAAMLVASRPWGPGILDLRLMGSLDALTVPASGTPQLFQQGGSANGANIVDAMHPNNALMELAARYTWNLDARTALFAYGGPAGEPALGPTNYMQRPSATENHWAPLGHHMQDAAHLSYGVATLGARRDDWQLEASAFNGREPDEYHFAVNLAPLDSYAARLSWFPGANWSFETSAGYLHDVGALMFRDYGFMPGMPDMGDVRRYSAAAMNIWPTPWGPVSSSLIWGQEQDLSSSFGTTQSYALESEWDGPNDHVYGRYELADRPGFAILTPRVNALTLGYLHDTVHTAWLDLGMGCDATAYSIDTSLEDIYGTNPFGFRIYFRLAPPQMQDPGSMAGMN